MTHRLTVDSWLTEMTEAVTRRAMPAREAILGDDRGVGGGETAASREGYVGEHDNTGENR
jgi:hypothetical protein